MKGKISDFSMHTSQLQGSICLYKEGHQPPKPRYFWLPGYRSDIFPSGGKREVTRDQGENLQDLRENTCVYISLYNFVTFRFSTKIFRTLNVWEYPLPNIFSYTRFCLLAKIVCTMTSQLKLIQGTRISSAMQCIVTSSGYVFYHWQSDSLPTGSVNTVDLLQTIRSYRQICYNYPYYLGISDSATQWHRSPQLHALCYSRTQIQLRYKNYLITYLPYNPPFQASTLCNFGFFLRSV